PVEAGVNGPDDYVGAHGDAALFALIDGATPVRNEDGGRGAKASQATVLLQLAREAGAECFKDDDVAYLHIPVNGHHETVSLRSRAGRGWLQGLYMDAIKTCAGTQAIADASNA